MKLMASIMMAIAEAAAKQAFFVIVVLIGFLTYATCAGLESALSTHGTSPALCPAPVMYSRSD